MVMTLWWGLVVLLAMRLYQGTLWLHAVKMTTCVMTGFQPYLAVTTHCIEHSGLLWLYLSSCGLIYSSKDDNIYYVKQQLMLIIAKAMWSYTKDEGIVTSGAAWEDM